MGRITFINIPASGHTNPTLPLVSELIHRGEDVSYYSFDTFQASIEQTGAKFHSYQHLLAIDYTRPDPNLFRLAATLLDATNIILPPLLKTIQQDQPDLLLYDSLCPWGKYIAYLLKIPAVCSTTTFAINARVAFISFAQVIDFARMFASAIPQLQQFQSAARMLTQTYQLPPPKPLDMFRNQAELTLVYTSAQFQPFAASFPTTFKFVGPSFLSHIVDTPLPFALPDDMPIIYISLGTLFNENISFYRLCFEAFANMAAHFVLSIGTKLAIEQLGVTPNNFTVRQSVPQLAVLRRAKVFVTHGGMNSVHEALHFGVPLVVIPQAADQQFVAQRVSQVGAGVRIEQRALNVNTLRDAVEHLLSEDRYQQASKAVGASLQAAGGYMRAADYVMEFKQSKHIV